MLSHIISVFCIFAVLLVSILAFTDADFVLYVQSIHASTVWKWLAILVAALFIVRVLRIIGDRLGWPQWMLHAGK
jgi:uncharacterized membrane protein